MGINKKFISLIIFSFFLICAGGSFDDSDIMFFITLIIALVIVGTIIIAIGSRNGNKLIKKEKEKKEERKKKLELELAKLKEEFSYNIDKSITYGYNSYIFVNESEQKIMLCGKVYNFTEIISFDVTDNSKVIYSPATSSTSTNTGSVIGRAVVGGLLTGGVGAIIGGTTAKRTTTTSGSESHIEHKFFINITIDSISDPIIRLYIGNNVYKANEISSLLSVIINRNNQ